MALVLADRVKETTTTTGTGTYTLAGAVTGFESFGSIGDSNTTYYCCTDGDDFEVGIGTYTSSGTTLARTTILQSSNSDNAVNWTSGTRTIFCTIPAEKLVFEDASGNIVVSGGEISMGPTSDTNRLRLIEDTQQTNEVLKIQNDIGHCTIGPQNSAYNHFVTDRSANYFNTEIQLGTGVIRSYSGDFTLRREASSTARIRITDGETHSDQNFTVSGLLSATTKSFVIDHPTKDGFKLRHGSLEGPENGVYVRGRTRENIIELPDYWKGLVDEDSVTINITPVGRDQGIYVESWDNQRIVLAGTAIDCFYTIYGERKDVDPFEVEYEE